MNLFNGGSGIPPAQQDIEQKRQKLLDHLLSDKGDGWTPTIFDLCYTAFMRAKGKNDEDGGPTDWFTDTRPLIESNIKTIKESITPPSIPAVTLSAVDDIRRDLPTAPASKPIDWKRMEADLASQIRQRPGYSPEELAADLVRFIADDIFNDGRGQ